MKHIRENFLVVSDYNWLPEDLDQSWVHKYAENYLIYDRFHRFKETNKVKWQKNVGQNIYDIFDFIVSNYDNLPETTIFCRGCIFNKKDDGIIRYDSSGKRISTGNCSEDYFLEICNRKSFTEIQDFTKDSWRFNGVSNKVSDDGGYLELNRNWWVASAKTRHYNDINKFFSDMYINPPIQEYIRFSPGGNYIIPRKNILRYSVKFYEKIRSILEWDVIIGEAHMIERALHTIFTCDYEVREEFR
jgi:hypothetical protein